MARREFDCWGVFSEFERAMIRDRVMAGLDRARSSGKRLGRPRTTSFKVQCILAALDERHGVRETVRLLKVVSRQGQRGEADVGRNYQVCTLDRSCQMDDQGQFQGDPCKA